MPLCQGPVETRGWHNLLHKRPASDPRLRVFSSANGGALVPAWATAPGPLAASGQVLKARLSRGTSFPILTNRLCPQAVGSTASTKRAGIDLRLGSFLAQSGFSRLARRTIDRLGASAEATLPRDVISNLTDRWCPQAVGTTAYKDRHLNPHMRSADILPAATARLPCQPGGNRSRTI